MSPKDILKIIESIELFIQKIEDTQAEVASTSSGTNSDTPSSEELTEPSVYNRTFLDVVKDNIPTEEERRGAEKEVAEAKAVAKTKQQQTTEAGAIASAIDAAIGIPGAITEVPVTPQRLKKILDENSI